MAWIQYGSALKARDWIHKTCNLSMIGSSPTRVQFRTKKIFKCLKIQYFDNFYFFYFSILLDIYFWSGSTPSGRLSRRSKPAARVRPTQQSSGGRQLNNCHKVQKFNIIYLQILKRWLAKGLKDWDITINSCWNVKLATMVQKLI